MGFHYSRFPHIIGRRWYFHDQSLSSILHLSWYKTYVRINNMKKILRIFSLNTEYGKYSDTFLPYLESICLNFDIFCFQEVPKNAKDITVFEEWYDVEFFQKLEKILWDFTPYYSEYVSESFGIVTFVRNSLMQNYIGEKYIFWENNVPFLDKGRWNNSTKLLAIKVEWVRIVNLHGAWQPKSKKQDTPERIIQSKIIKKFTRWKEKKTILIGDFNLNPDTKSVHLLEKKYTNLIKNFNISWTRTIAYNDISLPYADYAFTGRHIIIHDFEVHLDPVFSDHGFMTLTISRD
jgi:exonuclease III